MALAAPLSLPVRIDPLHSGPLHSCTSLTATAHGSGAGLHTSLSLFLRPSRPHKYFIPTLVSANVVQVEENSQQGPRRSSREGWHKDSSFKAQRLEDSTYYGQEDAINTSRTPSRKIKADGSFNDQPFSFRWKPNGQTSNEQVGAQDISTNESGLPVLSESGAKFSRPQTNAPQVFPRSSFRKAPWHQGGKQLFQGSEQYQYKEEDTQDNDNKFDDVNSKHFGGREEKSTMQRIVEKLRSVNKPSEQPKVGERQERVIRRAPGSVFLPKREQDVFSISKGWSTPDHPIPEPGKSIVDARFPWERDEEANLKDKADKEKRVKPPSLAELTIPQAELRRLRTLSLRLMQRVKIGRLGVTDNIVESIHQRWRTSEVVKVKCEGPSALNMKKIHEDLERKTGGMVIWKAGSVAVVYRGKDYDLLKSEQEDQTLRTRLENAIWSETGEEESQSNKKHKIYGAQDSDNLNDIDRQETNGEVSSASRVSKAAKPFDDLDEHYELEVENILADLGPRFEDWVGRMPVPVDGDLLPAFLPDYKPPFRLLPYGVRSNLSNAELTNLRRLARPLPPHFALGRNKGQHGLSAAMVKLWEKSEIAKIFVKRGVQNTNSERMAEELKRLTGGVLLSRDKFFITLYRGKDFLPKAVAAALAEREALTRSLQEEEEKARAETNIPILPDAELNSSTAGTLAGTLEAKATWQKWMDSEEQQKLILKAAKARRFEQARRIERRLVVALKKKEKAQTDLRKVELFLKPSDPPVDRETITEEERFMFRKLGLKMKAFLLIGRRGVFDGVVENMHLHWKHRELVKLIFKERDPVIIEETARMLEYESGGILVAVIATSKGQAIIVYRGKNYQRPSQLRPKNLLTKRKALKRSLEIQRRESLNRHILGLEKEIDKMKDGLSKMEELEQSQATQHLEENYDGTHQDQAQSKMEELEEPEAGQHLEETPDVTSQDGSVRDYEGVMVKHGTEELPGRNLEDDGKAEVMQNVLECEIVKTRGSSKLGQVFRAEPLTNREKLKLRKHALTMGKVAHFNVGKSNVVQGLAKAIRVYFQRHALVKIGVKGRARGTSIQELVHALEEETGGVLVSQEQSKVILYRGWPDGEDNPSSIFDDDDVSPELLAAMEEEDGYWTDGSVNRCFTEAESDDEKEEADGDLTDFEGMLSDEEGSEDEDDFPKIEAMQPEEEEEEEEEGFLEKGQVKARDEKDEKVTDGFLKDTDEMFVKDSYAESQELDVGLKGNGKWIEADDTNADGGTYSIYGRMKDECQRPDNEPMSMEELCTETETHQSISAGR